MKPFHCAVSFLIVALVLSSCGSKPSGSTETKSDSVSESPTTANDTEGASSKEVRVVLKGVYVTSVKTPQTDFNYTKLFDQDKNTYWATMPGAGPDEGIMLYFNEPVDIDDIELIQPENPSFSKISQVTIYVNGQKLDIKTIGDQPKFAIKAEKVESLFLRLTDFSDQKTLELGTDDNSIQAFTFPASKSAAISELKLYNAGKPINLSLPRITKGKISASSTLAPELSYGVRNLFDSRKEFAWVEGSPGKGENEFVTFTFDQAQTILGLRIMNGFQRSDKHYTANARAKTLSFASGSNVAQFVVADEQGEQKVSFSSPVQGKEFKLLIKEVYPGTSYKDLVISELKFIDANGDFIMSDDATESVKTDLQRKARGTDLAGVLDERVYNQSVDPAGGTGFERSIILRSDYTFVAYMEENSDAGAGSEKKEIIADGNWEIKSLSPRETKIRIFGKLVRLSESTDYYAGNSSSTFSEIFSDNLTITAEHIKGEKFIEEILRDQK